jgi:hypothetical protein
LAWSCARSGLMSYSPHHSVLPVWPYWLMFHLVRWVSPLTFECDLCDYIIKFKEVIKQDKLMAKFSS